MIARIVWHQMEAPHHLCAIAQEQNHAWQNCLDIFEEHSIVDAFSVRLQIDVVLE